jgi:hypothetical protein
VHGERIKESDLRKWIYSVSAVADDAPFGVAMAFAVDRLRDRYGVRFSLGSAWHREVNRCGRSKAPRRSTRRWPTMRSGEIGATHGAPLLLRSLDQNDRLVRPLLVPTPFVPTLNGGGHELTSRGFDAVG